MTDQAVAAEIGRRIEQLRLEQNRTQQHVADAVGLSRVSYARLVSGQGKFINLVAVLRVLGQIDQLEQFLPAAVFSPMAQLKLKGKQRQRAGGSRETNQADSANLANQTSQVAEPTKTNSDW